MALDRQQNFQGQQRVDVPHLRAVEAGVAHDFDVLAGTVLAGQLPSVVEGFGFITTAAVGNDAEKLVLRTAGGVVIHFEASENGSLFRTPDDRADETLGPTNARLVGAFTPNSTNFVGLDITRAADDSTSDTVMFSNPATSTESPRVVPLARTADYRIVVSTTEFSATPGLVPLAIVKTDAANKVTVLTDARYLLFRLGSGGSNPLSVAPYAWPGGRTELGALAAVGGDRSIFSFKDWLNAAMTRLWEIGGGEYWFSLTAYRNVHMNGSGTPFSSTGEFFEVVASNLHWKGLQVTFDNSTANINEVADQLTSSPGLTDLAVGECLYVDLDRTTDRTVAGVNALIPAKGVLRTLGGSATPGQRFVLAWRTSGGFFVRDTPYPVGSSLKLATTAASGTVKVTANVGDPFVPLYDTVTKVAICAGISRKNTASGALTGAGDIQIGLGLSEGDQNINIFTSGSQYGTLVQGAENFDTNGRSTVEVENLHSYNTGTKNRTQTLRGFDGSATRTAQFFESAGAIGVRNVPAMPAVPPASAAEPVRVKYFNRPNKFFYTAVRLATDAALAAYTPSGSGVGHTLTANANGALSIDGVAVANGNRVLIKNEGSSDNGIYTVTAAGSGGAPFVLVRATDTDQNGELVPGVTVHVTDGTINIDQYWTLDTDAPITVDTTTTAWVLTDNKTRDQVCALWFDGSYTVLAESPEY
jgi:hypothetical protein